MTDIQILQGIEGARQAQGLTVIIDVFRAFSLECYMAAAGAGKIVPVGSVGEAFAWRERDPECVLIGERGGAIVPGFDYGNSPSQVDYERIAGRTVIHTTSAGTQGIANAARADEIVTGSLVNARAVAEYIRLRSPEKVSLVCMGLAGVEERAEDTLCGHYIKSLLTGEPIDLEFGIEQLKTTSGRKFFAPEKQEIFPEEDFHMCTRADIFDFVIRIEHGISIKIPLHYK